MADKTANFKTLLTGLALSVLALLPILSWQALDARSSATVAAPAAAVVARSETIIRKTGRTWGHTKSDRLVFSTDAVSQTVRLASATPDAGKADREIRSEPEPLADTGEFADWLVPAGSGVVRIVNFAARKSVDNRKVCQSRHGAIVSAFAIKEARVMADQPLMFQSSICATNGEIVITCFGTSATISPRKARYGGFCAKPD